ncbi:hypothetical protein P170DRAFT_511820 [Aspergillus steynii IBT 23096]|uniref:Beta/gamma crystallin 'Greek key' domain-containing protein n=1 Tax=Aspergillus steynii IBT 23096 TaxID=1392250 RepID=A0A2I2G2T5_9EURO|nr:uncharacterized protein P170DRAFT_511820 [Aspergillus steynii IBT 23096]PLB47179.1 hypothetical protein P170DRAFT_511820 [Aspergillus steynii IBT 23096]
MLFLQTATISLLGLLAVTATAQPIFLPDGQEIDVVTVWQEVNRQGDRMGLCDLDMCSWFLPGDTWNKAISSMMVTDGYSCTVWESSNCAGAPLRSDMRGAFDDLRVEGINDMVGSLKCRELMV